MILMYEQRVFFLHEGLDEIKRRVFALQQHQNVVMLHVAGGSGAGKTYIAEKLRVLLSGSQAISMDSYYLPLAEMPDDNFDVPTSLDLMLLKHDIFRLKRNQSIQKPLYDFTISDRVGHSVFESAPIIIVEGMYALHELVRDLADIKVYIQAPPDVRLTRKIARDIAERKRTRESVLKQWNMLTFPMHHQYVKGQKQFSDLIIHND